MYTKGSSPPVDAKKNDPSKDLKEVPSNGCQIEKQYWSLLTSLLVISISGHLMLFCFLPLCSIWTRHLTTLAEDLSILIKKGIGHN